MEFKSYENDGNLMAEGDYEAILLKAVETSNKNTGEPVIRLDFQIRSDVEQKYRRKHIFKSFYQDENGQWPMEKIGKMANALGIPKEEEFDLPDLVGKCCLLHVKPCKGRDGVERDTIYFAKATKAGQAVQSAPMGTPEGYQEVTDEEDFPFD